MLPLRIDAWLPRNVLEASMKNALGFVVGCGIFLAASPSAFAQPPAEPTPQTAPRAPAAETPPTPEPTPVAPPPPAPAPAPAAPEAAPKADDGITDHEKVVGKLGVMYFGFSQQPIGTGPAAIGPNAAANVGKGRVPMPVIGVRYWLQERLGLDLGLGFTFLSSGDTRQPAGAPEVKADGPAVLAFGIHGGLPLAFAYGKHYKFLLVPELNFGYATQTAAAQNVPPGSPAISDLHLSGIRLDVGARVGSEIQFGFIGIPELALQASVGLSFRHERWSASQDAAPPGVPAASSASSTESTLGTTVQADPWALFVNNISAIYYFP
jgi:hypothetical protein